MNNVIIYSDNSACIDGRFLDREESQYLFQLLDVELERLEDITQISVLRGKQIKVTAFGLNQHRNSMYKNWKEK